eukprot:gnl/MRDRNA2_/MRDRNA2_164283_c0_seq1.p1 gnl/MRDRNA2_/MRDRNA2_164283_c0~~gnl/MRDRNA2_/MRDRNA2_164283_c0_seq1.p1  ORF type:complete len:556 (-),score=145.13 gnl/MRDRNA2_/MRDRNA2_164283_c0_seq1:210-1877(-)
MIVCGEDTSGKLEELQKEFMWIQSQVGVCEDLVKAPDVHWGKARYQVAQLEVKLHQLQSEAAKITDRSPWCPTGGPPRSSSMGRWPPFDPEPTSSNGEERTTIARRRALTKRAEGLRGRMEILYDIIEEMRTSDHAIDDSESFALTSAAIAATRFEQIPMHHQMRSEELIHDSSQLKTILESESMKVALARQGLMERDILGVSAKLKKAPKEKTGAELKPEEKQFNEPQAAAQSTHAEAQCHMAEESQLDGSQAAAHAIDAEVEERQLDGSQAAAQATDAEAGSHTPQEQLDELQAAMQATNAEAKSCKAEEGQLDESHAAAQSTTLEAQSCKAAEKQLDEPQAAAMSINAEVQSRTCLLAQVLWEEEVRLQSKAQQRQFQKPKGFSVQQRHCEQDKQVFLPAKLAWGDRWKALPTTEPWNAQRQRQAQSALAILKEKMLIAEELRCGTLESRSKGSPAQRAARLRAVQQAQRMSRIDEFQREELRLRYEIRMPPSEMPSRRRPASARGRLCSRPASQPRPPNQGQTTKASQPTHHPTKPSQRKPAKKPWLPTSC